MRAFAFAAALAALAFTLAPHPAGAQAPSLYAQPQQLAVLPDARRINLVCQGQGTPTVILTAGAGDWSASWNRVLPLVAQKTRACAWDRPGYGFSDASPQPQSAANLASDLAAALKAAGIAAPYVLVSHSAGSFETLLFAGRNPGAVAGMVLLDPSIPELFSRVGAISPLAATALRADVTGRAAAYRRCAANPAQPAAADAAICFRLPEHARALVGNSMARDHDAARLATRASLFEQFEANTHQAAPAPSLGDMPLTILTSETEPVLVLPVEQPARTAALEKLWNDAHDAQAALSRHGSNRTVAGSGHQIQLEQPGAVAAAINAIVDGNR